MPRRSHDGGLVRLNKLLAGKGVASRRRVEEMIIEGRIRVDGELAAEKGLKVRPGARIEVDGRVVGDPPPLAWVALHKPRGYVCTKEDSRDRPIVMDLLPPELSHLHPVGRLDGDVSGLLLFTNEGELTHRLTHPRYGIEKVYQGRTTSPMRPQQAQALEDGIELEDGPSYPAKCRTLAPSGSGSLVELRIHEGRKHQVKRMFEAVGNPLVQLERVAVGPVELADLGRGRYRPLTPYEVIELHKRTMLPIPKGLARRSGAEAGPDLEREGEPKPKAPRKPRGDARPARPPRAERVSDADAPASEATRPRARKPRPPLAKRVPDAETPASDATRPRVPKPRPARRETEPQRPAQPSGGRPDRREKRGSYDQSPVEDRPRGRSAPRQAGRPGSPRPPRGERPPIQRERQGPPAWGGADPDALRPTRQPPERPPAWGGAEKPAGRARPQRSAQAGGRPSARRERKGPPAWGEGGSSSGKASPERGTQRSDRPGRPSRDAGQRSERGSDHPRRGKRPGGQSGGGRRPPRPE